MAMTETQSLPLHRIEKPVAVLLFTIATALSVFQLWQGVLAEISATYFRPIHLSWILVLVFLRYPTVKDAASAAYLPGRLLDFALCAFSIWAGWLVVDFDYTGLDHLLNGLNHADYLAGAGLMFLTIEATRRSVGWEMALIGLVFLLYVLFGNLLPDAMANRGFSLERVVRFQVFTSEGLYGAPLGIAATAVGRHGLHFRLGDCQCRCRGRADHPDDEKARL
jgi:TRAP-type uncharacterized transport system fused permease subunit